MKIYRFTLLFSILLFATMSTVVAMEKDGEAQLQITAMACNKQGELYIAYSDDNDFRIHKFNTKTNKYSEYNEPLYEKLRTKRPQSLNVTNIKFNQQEKPELIFNNQFQWHLNQQGECHYQKSNVNFDQASYYDQKSTLTYNINPHNHHVSHKIRIDISYPNSVKNSILYPYAYHILSIAFNDDGNYFVTIDRTGYACLWDIEKNREIINNIALNSQGFIHQLNTKEECTLNLEGKARVVTSINNNIFVIGYQDNSIRYLILDPVNKTLKFYNESNGTGSDRSEEAYNKEDKEKASSTYQKIILLISSYKKPLILSFLSLVSFWIAYQTCLKKLIS